MKSFYEKISQTCKKYKKVAMFIDMDGTISEYHVYEEEKMPINTKGVAINQKPLNNIIEKLKMISNIHNIDLYILTLSKSNLITKEKKEWLKKYISFIKKENWIIIDRENGEYNAETRNYIKTEKIKEKISNDYEHIILLDDDHNVLKQTLTTLKDKYDVYHISSAII